MENITTEDWAEFIEEIAKRIKDKKPYTVVVVGFVLHHPENLPVSIQLIGGNNDVDIIGNDPYSVDEMLNTENYLKYWHESPDKRGMWITETWGNGDISYEGIKSASYIKFAVYYAQKKGFNGFVLFGGSSSMHKGDKFKKLDTFYTYKKVIEEVKDNAIV